MNVKGKYINCSGGNYIKKSGFTQWRRSDEMAVIEVCVLLKLDTILTQ